MPPLPYLEAGVDVFIHLLQERLVLLKLFGLPKTFNHPCSDDSLGQFRVVLHPENIIIPTQLVMNLGVKRLVFIRR